jgi:hypothetical protein
MSSRKFQALNMKPLLSLAAIGTNHPDKVQLYPIKPKTCAALQ